MPIVEIFLIRNPLPMEETDYPSNHFIQSSLIKVKCGPNIWENRMIGFL